MSLALRGVIARPELGPVPPSMHTAGQGKKSCFVLAAPREAFGTSSGPITNENATPTLQKGSDEARTSWGRGPGQERVAAGVAMGSKARSSGLEVIRAGGHQGWIELTLEADLD